MLQEMKRSYEDMKNEEEGGGGTESMKVDPDPIDGRPRRDLMTVLCRPSAFANESGALPFGEFEPISTPTCQVVTSDLAESPLKEAKVLVVGAGGLGCEMLKNLALSGISDIHVIDMDGIDITNLNRQFLFRTKDVGSSKANVAAAFINSRCPWMKVEAHHAMIQDKDSAFFASFNCIISGLDNVEARRWLNATLCGLVEFDSDGDPDPTTIIPLIDGGTEGFAGQARIILPRLTSCFECSLDAFPQQTSFPLCTIAETPRRPEHCIAYAFILQWPREFPEKKLDNDNPDHMKWVYEKALERATNYNIAGVTYMLTMGVVKKIIPAVASTNAIVAAACVNEAVKLLTLSSQNLNTYMMYMGSQGVYSHTFSYEKKEDCPVCTATVQIISLARTTTLNELIQELRAGNMQLKAPSITSSTGITLYMQKPPALEKATRANLDKPLSSLIGDEEELTVTDPVLEHAPVTIRIQFEN